MRISKIHVITLLLTLLMSVPAGLFAQPAVKGNAAQFYSIAPGGLAPALMQFARRSGVNLSYDATLVEDAETRGLAGTYTVEKGLEALLSGTGLVAIAQPGGWLIRRVPPPKSTPAVQDGGETKSKNGFSGAVELPSLVVRDTMGSDQQIFLEQAHRTLASDVSDLFSATPSVTVGGGGRSAQRIYLRGIESSNLNVTIDGARQGRTLFQHHGTISSLDPDMLKQVEVQTGAGAESGPGALGGSIRFRTVDAQDLLLPGQTTGARLKTGYAGVDDTLQGSADAYALFKGHLGILAHVSGSNREDYEDGDGDTVLNTAGQDRDYLFKLSLLDLASHSLRLGAQLNSSSGDSIWGGLGSDMGVATDTQNAVRQEMERTSYTLEHLFMPKDQPMLNWKLNLYRNENQLENVDADNTVTSTESGGAVKNIAAFELGPTRHSFTTAMDFFQEKGAYETAGEKTTNESQNFGLAIQERMNISRLILTAGARFDDYSSDYGSETVYGSEVSPNVGGEFELIKGLSLFAEYSEAVRGSGIIPVQWLASIADDVVINGGRAVKPERSTSREGGIRYNVSGLVFPEDHLSAQVTFFNTHLTNTIEVETGGARGAPITAIYNNSDTLRSTGYEVTLDWGFKAVQTRMTFSSFDTEDSDGNPVGIIRRKAAASGDQFVWDTRWAPTPRITLGYTLTCVADLTEVPEGDSERPGYVLHGLQASWRPERLPGLTLSLAVDNLFDKYYADQSSIEWTNGVVPEPGRDVRLAVTYQF